MKNLNRYSRELESTVDIWTISLIEERSPFLSPDEEERAARFRFENDRVRWIRARSALRLVLSGYLASAPETLRFTYNENGKPALAGIEFNLSHAGDFAMIAISESAPVGIDIERIRPEVEIRKLLERLGEIDLPYGVDELYARWTRREARTKAAGGQLFVAPADSIHAIDVAAPEGYSAAVALMGFEPVIRSKIEHA
jgi:4'-phosphopantetheinyl transferase